MDEDNDDRMSGTRNSRSPSRSQTIEPEERVRKEVTELLQFRPPSLILMLANRVQALWGKLDHFEEVNIFQEVFLT